jgi:hypothetical protein
MATFTREYERVTCPGCHRQISAYVPHFGDGTGLRLVKHKLAKARRRNTPCPFSERIIVRERGKWRLDL